LSGRAFSRLPLDKLEIKLDKLNVGYLSMGGDTLRTYTIATVTKPNVNEAFFDRATCRPAIRMYWPFGASTAPTVGPPTSRASARRLSFTAR
jgi:hypothetical protein